MRAASGVKAALIGPSCLGWIAALPVKPRSRTRRHSRASPASSSRSRYGTSIASRPQLAAACTTRLRAYSSEVKSRAAPSSAAMSTAPNRSDLTAAAGAGDRARLVQPGVALDDHVQADRPRRALQERIDDPHLVGGFDLRQHDAIGRGRMLDDREQVLEAERRAHAVDAHHPLDAIRARAVEQGHGTGARLVLVRRDHGVLEVDRDHVRSGGERFREPVRPSARHEQQIAARLDRLGHRLASSLVRGERRLLCHLPPGAPLRPGPRWRDVVGAVRPGHRGSRTELDSAAAKMPGRGAK